MVEKAKTPTTKATATGGAKVPPKDPAAIVAKKMAAADAAEKGLQSQLLAPSGSAAVPQQAAEPKAGGPKPAESAPESELPPMPPDDVMAVYTAAAAAVPPAFLEPAKEDDVDDGPAKADDAEAPTEDLALDAEDEEVVSKIEKLDAPVAALLPEVRYKQGEVLITAYFSGDKPRPKYGEKVMQIIELRLGIAASDLYRAVRFAQKFKTFAAFRQQYPKATWSKVKELVVDKPKSKPTRKKNEWQTRVDKVNEFLGLMEEKKEQAELRKNVAPAALLELRSRLAKANDIFGQVIAPLQPQEPDQQKLHDKLVADNERLKLLLAEAINQGWKPSQNALDIAVETTRRLEAASTPASDNPASDEPAEEPATT